MFKADLVTWVNQAETFIPDLIHMLSSSSSLTGI